MSRYGTPSGPSPRTQIRTTLRSRENELNSLRRRMEAETSERAKTEASAVGLAKSLLATSDEAMSTQLASLRKANEELRARNALLESDAVLSQETLSTLEAKVARRETQSKELVRRLEALQEEKTAATLAKGGSSTAATAAELESARREMLEYRFRLEEANASIVTLHRELEEKRAVLGEQKEDRKVSAEAQKTEIRLLQAELAHERRLKEELSTRLSTLETETTVKKAELHSLRERLNTETPIRKTLRRTSSREDLLVQEVARLRTQIETLLGGNKDDAQLLRNLSEELGALKADRANADKRIAALVDDKGLLQAELEKTRERVKDLEDELERYKNILNDRDVDSNRTHEYLVEEISKVKLQKAELRCRFRELERKNGRLATSSESLSTISTHWEKQTDSEVTAAKAAASALEKELIEKKAKIATMKEELSDVNRRASEWDSDRAAARTRLAAVEAERMRLAAGLADLDEQYGRQEELRLRQKAELDALRASLREKDEELAQDSVDVQSTARTIAALTRDRDREQAKATDLQAELDATHKDYRDQLALLLSKLSDNQGKESSHASKLSMLEHSLRDANKEITSLRAKLSELEKERDRASSELARRDAELRKATEERDKASSHLLFAVEKAEKFKAEKEAALKEKETFSDLLTRLQKETSPKPRNPDPFNRGPQNELERKLQDVRNKYGMDSPLATGGQVGEPSSALLQRQKSHELLHSRNAELREQVQKLSHRVHFLEGQVREDLERSEHLHRAELDAESSVGDRASVDEVDDPHFKSRMSAHEDTASISTNDSASHLTYDSAEPFKPQMKRERLDEDLDETAHDAQSLASTGATSDGDSVQLIHAAPLKLTSSTESVGGGPASPFAVSRAGSQSTDGGSSGTMRHNIPHRWKRFLVMMPVKCLVCMDGLAIFRHGFKCSDCSIVVHAGCTETLLNTCGLPMHLTEYYFETLNSTSPAAMPMTPATKASRRRESIMETPSEEGRMTGWVKLWRTRDAPGSWRQVWGCMDAARLVFYPQDSQYCEPVESIELEKQRWKIHFERGIEREDQKSVARDDLPYLVEIKIVPEDGSEPYRLYMMCPTLPAKQRWVNALQVATTRRLFARRVSSLKLHENCFLRLEGGSALGVRCVAPLDERDLILGCDQGLFYTKFRQPGPPIRIGGLNGKVFQMEIFADVDILAIINGDGDKDRQLSFLHVADLQRSLRSSAERGVAPAVKESVSPFPELRVVHLMTSVEAAGALYLVVADPSHIFILKFSQRIGSFKKHHSVKTDEPAACLERLGDKVIVGTDAFYLLDPTSGLLQDFYDPDDKSLDYVVRKAPARQEFPSAATVLSQPAHAGDPSEILLSYQNFGLFVNGEGRRTRRQTVEWVRSPLQLAYTAPYLYVVHFESIEVFQVPSLVNLDSPCLEAVSLLELGSPQLVGSGATAGDLFFTSVRSTRGLHKAPQLLLLNAFSKPESGGFLKRKALERENSAGKRVK